jgi:hypothetical protein
MSGTGVTGASPQTQRGALVAVLTGCGIAALPAPAAGSPAAWPEAQQDENSGLSGRVPGSSLGTAIAGTILVAGPDRGGYSAAMSTLAVAGLPGLAAAARLPRA